MALLFMDSFDHYATADITEKWTASYVGGSGVAISIASAGRNGTQAVQHNAGSAGTFTAYLSKTVAPGSATCIMGFGINTTIAAIGSGGQAIAAINDGGTDQLTLMLNEDFTIGVRRGARTGTELGRTTAAIQTSVYYFIELKATIHSSTGSVYVRINGTEELALTSQNTQNTAAAQWNVVRIGVTSSCAHDGNGTVSFDDVYVCDSTGSLNNDLLGDVTIRALYASGAGNTTGWTPSTGSNYACVDEALVNDDTDYVSATAANTKDTYAWNDVTAGAEIKAVQVVSAMRKASDGPGKYMHVIRSSGTDYDSSEIPIASTSYAFQATIHETDPATGVAWTENGFNNAEFGVKKTG